MFAYSSTVILFFVFAGIAAAQTLAVNPQQVSLASPAGSATPAVQTVGVLSPQPNLQFTAAARYLGSTIGWLSVSPATGTVPATLSITANPAGLAAGAYAGQVTVSAGGFGAVVNVLFTVGSGSGGFSVSPSSLTFLADEDAGILPSQTLSVTNAPGVTGAAGFTAFASSNGQWLSVSPLSATTPAVLNVGAIAAGLNGTFSGTVTITPTGGGIPTVVPVTLSAVGGTGVADNLTLSQTAVTINHQIGKPVPPVQAVGVVAGESFRQYTASTTTSWLRLVTPFNLFPAVSITDFSPGEFNIMIVPAGLSEGLLAGSVTVAAEGLPAQTIPVLLRVSSTPALNASPSSVQLDDETEGAVVVTATGAANLSFTASVAAPASSWLSVSPTSGSTSSGSQVLTLRVNTAALPIGTHTATVVLSQGSGPTLNIPVRVRISESDAEGGELLISPESIEISGIVGIASRPQRLTINVSDLSIDPAFTASATSTGGWLSVQPFSGVAPLTMTVTANGAAVPRAGTYEGSVVITSLANQEQTTIPVMFTVVEKAILADPESLSFVQPKSGVAPQSQTIQVRSNTPSTFSVTNVPEWVRVSPAQGTTPGTLTVWVPTAIVPPGTTSGTIRVSGPDNQLTIPVSVSVPAPAAPTATPESITFAYQLGGPTPPSQSITVGSTAETINFNVAVSTQSGSDWLVVTPGTGSTPATLTVSVNTSRLVPGQQTATIRLTTSDPLSEPRVINVTMTVTASNTVVQGLLNGATLAPTPMAPGQIVSITGTGLGPATGVVAQPSAAGAIAPQLANVRVLFEGVPAPLLYVRVDQINAIVPYAMRGRNSARIQVEAGTNFSVPIDTRVVDAAPGIFTTEGSGRGQAAALNVDLSTNSSTNPAGKGDVITIFGTGEGQTDPPGQDGRVILTDLRRPLLPVTATIGGRTAEVVYIGSAPSQVSGIFQANIRIPADVESGVVPVQMQFGGTPTQSGVTIAVR